MTNYSLDVTLDRPFANLFRKRHVLVVVMDEKGDVVLGKKRNYPEGISRLMGGGVDEGEEYETAAIREIKEEMNVENPTITPLLMVNIKAVTPGDEYLLETMIYLLNTELSKIIPGDDTDGLQIMKPSGLLDMADRYEHLSGVFVSGDYSHNWSDYGKVYGPIHRRVYQELKDRNLIS